jgi:hypothetical protein
MEDFLKKVQKFYSFSPVLRILFRHPVFFDPWIPDVKNPDLGSGMNTPDLISESLLSTIIKT